MMKIGVHITVGMADGTVIAEMASTETVLNPDASDKLKELSAASDVLDEMIEHAREKCQVQMADFGKIVSSQ